MAALAILAGGAALVGWASLADARWAEQHVLPSYCATNEAERIAARSVRPLVAALGFAAMLAAPALARVLARARPRLPGPEGVVSVAVAVVASAVVCEAYLRHVHHRLAYGAEPERSGAGRQLAMTRADPRLGWSYFPSRTTWTEVAGRRIAYTIDADGDRGRSIDERLDPGRATVLFTGESIAFGYGVRFEETAPFLVGRDLGLQAVNLAVVGYGNDQAYLRVLDAFARVPHPVAVVTLFIPDQIRRNVDTWRPRLALDASGALELVPPSAGPRIAKLLEELPWHGGEALRITAATLRATAEAATARGALPLFVVTNYGSPCLRRDGDEAWMVQELFVRQGLTFVRVDLGPEDRLPGMFEGHPNPEGMRKIADAVERVLAERLGMRLGEPVSSQPSR